MTDTNLTIKLAYSVPNFADANDVSESQIWAEIANGELESIKVGDRRLITAEQGVRWHQRKAERARRLREEREALKARLSEATEADASPQAAPGRDPGPPERRRPARRRREPEIPERSG
jgi:hypothetical protein